MILYTETNFVFELAFLRDEVDEAEALLRLAESKRIELVIPAFSMSEPYEAMTRRSRDRKALLDRVSAEIAELRRSRPYSELEALSRGFTSAVANSATEEWDRLRQVQQRLLGASTIVPLESAVIRRAMQVGPELDLSAQDAIVFASVESHLQASRPARSCFATKNRKDFLTGEVEDRLKDLGCRLVGTFEAAYSYIEREPTGS
jgi:predicted nucleic acid-binding protein